MAGFWHERCFMKNVSRYPSPGSGNVAQVPKRYRGPFPRCQGPLNQLNCESGPGLVSYQPKPPSESHFQPVWRAQDSHALAAYAFPVTRFQSTGNEKLETGNAKAAAICRSPNVLIVGVTLFRNRSGCRHLPSRR